MRAYVNKSKAFVAVFFPNIGDWTIHKMTKKGEVHHGFAPAHVFTASFNDALPIARKQTSNQLPSSGWSKHTLSNTGTARSVNELFEMIYNNKL